MQERSPTWKKEKEDYIGGQTWRWREIRNDTPKSMLKTSISSITFHSVSDDESHYVANSIGTIAMVKVKRP